MEILGKQRDILDRLAALLMEKEKIGAVEFEALFTELKKEEELPPHEEQSPGQEPTGEKL